MERFKISKSEKQTIYEIYRACRICGAGGGYRMPIIQNIVDLETSDVELRQKIQDCLQLEVRSDDRMPPLICELCVDKVNDFYAFLELSRQTNTRTRSRLGLPLQPARKGESDSGDCILGVTEPLCADEPAPKRSKAGPKCSKNVKKETENVNVKVEPAPSPAHSRSSSVSSRSGRAARRPATPPRPARAPPKTEAPKTTPVTQEKKRVKEKEKEKEPEKVIEVKGSKSVSRKELQDLLQDSQKYDDNSLLVPRSMKRKEVEPPRPALIPKRTRITPKEPIKEPVKEPAPEPAPPRRKPGPKSKQAPPVEEPKIPVPLKIPKSKSKLTAPPPKVEAPPPKISTDCPICDVHLKTNAALANHLKSHIPTYTKSHVACNPCGKWFVTTEEATTHHRYHRAATFPYHCRRCFEDYSSLQDYDSHIRNGLCMPYEVVPDVKCDKCWKTFITQTLLDGHKCQGYDGRPGGNCTRCSRPYATLRTLKAHQRVCLFKKKHTGDLIADPDVLRRLKPMQVRIARCDDLLARRPDGRCDAAAVKPNHGLDKNYLYPYIRFKPVKPKPVLYRGTVSIHGAVREEPERDRYIHWDSEDSDSDSVIKKVDSLTTLCLKKIFSKDILGKVPRKKRRIENDAFDSINDFSIGSDINDIISSLNDDLGNDCVRKTRKDSLIAIAINDIIGVPNSFVPSLNLGIENVARSSNDVQIDDKNENSSDLNIINENVNEIDKSKDLNDVEVENEGTDTVVSASDISTELNLKETEEQENTLKEPASEIMAGDMEINDSETRNDLSKNKDENVDLNNDEIRKFRSVDGQSSDDSFKYCNETIVQSNNLSSDNQNAVHNNSEINTDNFEHQTKPDTMDANNDLEQQNANTDDAIRSNDSEMSNDNLDFKNNYENIDIDNELESQNENPHYDLEKRNGNLGTGNNHGNSAIDNAKTKNGDNEDVQLNSETDIQNYNYNINHTNLKNIDGNDDINNAIETQNENLKDVNLSSDTNTQNANFSRDHLENEKNENIETEISQDTEEVLEEPSILNSTENELQNFNVNDIHENNTNTKSNSEDGDKSEEINKTTKESPIKHSIDNLIGPDKYIDEVISIIEDIININPRNEEMKDSFTNGENSNQMGDQMLMDALDEQIGESKDKMDSEKITLDDLLPKNNKPMELDDISDEDLDFDA